MCVRARTRTHMSVCAMCEACTLSLTYALSPFYGYGVCVCTCVSSSHCSYVHVYLEDKGQHCVSSFQSPPFHFIFEKGSLSKPGAHQLARWLAGELLMLLLVCVCVCVLLYDVCMCACLCARVETRGRNWASSCYFYLISRDRVSWWIWTGWPVNPEVLLVSTCHHSAQITDVWSCGWHLHGCEGGIWTQIFTYGWQTLYLLSHLSNSAFPLKTRKLLSLTNPDNKYV